MCWEIFYICSSALTLAVQITAKKQNVDWITMGWIKSANCTMEWRLLRSEYKRAVTFVMQMTLITGLVQKQYVIIENCREEKCYVAGTYVDISHGILLWSWSCWHFQSSHHKRIACIPGSCNQNNNEAPVLDTAPAHPPDGMDSYPLKNKGKDGADHKSCNSFSSTVDMDINS